MTAAIRFWGNSGDPTRTLGSLPLPFPSCGGRGEGAGGRGEGSGFIEAAEKEEEEWIQKTTSLKT